MLKKKYGSNSTDNHFFQVTAMRHLRRLPFQTSVWRQRHEDQPDRQADQPEGRGHPAVHGRGLEEAGVHRTDLPEHDVAGNTLKT